MKFRVLPIIQVLLFALLMYGIRTLFPFMVIQFSGQWMIALLILVFGVLIVLLGGMRFRAAGTTFNPLEPERVSSLVVSGVYRHSRNPMYLGFFLVLLAWAVYLGSILSVLLVFLFILVINRVYILPEETVLLAKFGPDYAAYCKKVRRWL